MKFEKIHNKGQAQLFKSPALELLTKAPPLLIWGMYLPFIIGMPIYAHTKFGFSGAKIAIWFIGAMFFWSFFEYLAHRYAFHFTPKSERTKKIVYIMHGNHHHYPRDRQRLFMPPLPSIILATVLFSVQFLILKENAYVFFPGFLLGYLMYASMHYAIQDWNPPFKWMKPLWRNHHLHHYKDEEKGFGVSSTIWDHLFGTMFDLKKEKEDKEKVKSLMFEQTK